MKRKALLLLSILLLVAAAPLYAQDAQAGRSLAVLGLAIGAGLAIGIAALGGGLGQGRAAAAALEGIARNPQAAGSMFTPLILGLAFIESLVIYGLLIALVLWIKI